MLFSPLYATMIAIVILVFIIVVFGQVRIIFYVFVICIKDRLLDRHLCLNFYPCVIKVQSVSLSLSHCKISIYLLPGNEVDNSSI